MRNKVSLATAGALALLVIACGKTAKEEEQTFDVAGGLAGVKAARSELMAARDLRDTLRAELQALEEKRQLSPEETSRKGVLETELKNSDTKVDLAFAEDQSRLAGFLNEALNQLPQAPETREALRLYADETIRTATEFMDRAGDYRRAIEVIETAKSYFEAVELPVPAELETAQNRAREFRYLTKERFDQLRKGMTEAQVKLIAGTPFYANIRESELRGKKIVSWLFNREDNEVAAIYFQNAKVYALKWNVKEQ